MIGQSAVEQGFNGRLVEVQPLRLIIRGMGAADFGAFVPVDAHPVQPAEDRPQGLLDVPLLVGVVDAQDELAAVVPGKQPAEQAPCELRQCEDNRLGWARNVCEPSWCHYRKPNKGTT